MNKKQLNVTTPKKLRLGSFEMAKNKVYHRLLYENYARYKESEISRRRFTHGNLQKVINRLGNNNIFTVSKLGHSVEGREINLIQAGVGKTKILLWSQMHGDESTASMALLDIFNYFTVCHSKLRDLLLKRLTLYFIPMLNPDGAERFQRRNAMDIDLNRDALSLQCPESKLLKNACESIKPEFGFNLHDQSTRYSTGHSFKSASISFLAPPYNAQRDINPVRLKAMKIISHLYQVLSDFIPGHIAKYSDEFEPRAFGDNIQRWGTSTVLIETGGWYNDFEKQFLRKINFIALLSAFESIACNQFEKYSQEDYCAIPDNDKYIFDLILRNVQINTSFGNYRLDIGINRNEENDGQGGCFFRGIIEDMGDLSVYFGLQDIDCSGMELIQGKVLNRVIQKYENLGSLNFPDLLAKGIICIPCRKVKPAAISTSFPIIVTSGKHTIEMDKIAWNSPANFVVTEKGKVRFTVINGFIFDALTATGHVNNGLILQ